MAKLICKKKVLKSLLVALGMSTITSIYPRTIKGYRRIETDRRIQTEETSGVLDDIKRKIEFELSKEEANIDFIFSGYIKGIKIDGKNVEIELIDGDFVTGVPNTINISNIYELNYLHIVDTEYIKAYLDYSYLEPTRRNPVINITNIEVTTEIKYMPFLASFFPYEGEFIEEDGTNYLGYHKIEEEISNNLRNINFSQCKNVWFYGITLNDSIYRQINDGKIERLYLTHCKDEDGIIVLNSSTIQTLIIEELATIGNYKNRILGIDVNGCKKINNLQFGSFTCVDNLNGFFEDLHNLRCLSFGKTTLDTLNILLDDFELREQHIYNYSNKYPETVSINFISDLSAIEKNSSLEILDISELRNVSSSQLYNTITKLPNLKKIIGNDSNNACMYSEDLVKWCKEKNIQHPFTDKSKKIKEKLQSIIYQITTKEMNDEEKIKSILKYVIVKMYPDYDLLNKAKNNGDIREEYENSLYNALFLGKGVCDGYERLFHALLMEANIRSYAIGIPDHVVEVVEKDNKFYRIDPTFLDYYLSSYTKMSEIDDSELKKSSYYMKDVFELLLVYDSYAIPAEWNKQHIEKNKEIERKEKKEEFNVKLSHEVVFLMFLTGIIIVCYETFKKMNRNKNDERVPTIIKKIDDYFGMFSIENIRDYFNQKNNIPSSDDLNRVKTILESKEEEQKNEEI